NKYLRFIDYFTTSSQPIAEAYQKLYPDKIPVTILNAFPINASIREPEININGFIKLLWFSQTIGPNRGIEDIIDALAVLKNHPFELHLMGFISTEKRDSFIGKQIFEKSLNIHFHDPVRPDDLATFASGFDIGLASEPAFSINNNLALSNKIFTYLQAGLAVVASDTAGQLSLLNEYPSIGKIYQKGNVRSLADTLLFYQEHREELLEARKASYMLARKNINWETEGRSFLAVVEKILNTQ
ncbi:MAG TPA: glycosyltransferase, partial [Mucilaginibacter sp.]|nr:glycosyltransferase [Mucilaginibacter sp.]